ncbi:MAG: outer membrane lipoprotein LolB [Legionellales bacterium]|nr:outer membrane lipoprotein LolB [Legionellales bacterium]
MKFTYCLPIGLTLVLSACTSITPVAPPTATVAKPVSWSQRQQQLSTVTAWNLQGAIGMQQNDKHWSASINWQQEQASNYTIRLFGPFGAGATVLQGQPGQVSLVTNDHPQPVISTNPESLIAKETGWNLPVSNLYYWVRSIPAPGAPSSITLDQANRLSTLQQAGWQINYLDYTTVNGLDLPSTIRLNSPNFSIKLVIKEWSFTHK